MRPRSFVNSACSWTLSACARDSCHHKTQLAQIKTIKINTMNTNETWSRKRPVAMPPDSAGEDSVLLVTSWKAVGFAVFVV
jgi:hypothetical protein